MLRFACPVPLGNTVIFQMNPVDALDRACEASDVRKERRALTLAEASRLLDVAGPRRLFYHVLLFSGLRVSEVKALRWSDIDLVADRPVIRLRAEATKAKRADELPIHTSLRKALQRALRDGCVPLDPVFRSTPILRTWKRDLERAGIDFEDDRGRTVDRHAARTTFISWLGLCGVDPRAQIKLARHAPTGVTFKHYQDFGVFETFGGRFGSSQAQRCLAGRRSQ